MLAPELPFLPLFAPLFPTVILPQATPAEFIKQWLVRHHRLSALAELSPRLHLVNDLELDSLERIELVVEVEQRFHVDIPAPEVADLQRVADVLSCVQRLLK